jgi:hypothetical protein
LNGEQDAKDGVFRRHGIWRRGEVAVNKTWRTVFPGDVVWAKLTNIFQVRVSKLSSIFVFVFYIFFLVCRSSSYSFLFFRFWFSVSDLHLLRWICCWLWFGCSLVQFVWMLILVSDLYLLRWFWFHIFIFLVGKMHKGKSLGVVSISDLHGLRWIYCVVRIWIWIYTVSIWIFLKFCCFSLNVLEIFLFQFECSENFLLFPSLDFCCFKWKLRFPHAFDFGFGWTLQSLHAFDFRFTMTLRFHFTFAFRFRLSMRCNVFSKYINYSSVNLIFHLTLVYLNSWI